MFKIVHVHARDGIFKGGMRRHLREIRGGIAGTTSLEASRATRRVVKTTTAHLLYRTLSAVALEEWSHGGKTGTDDGDGAFDNHPVKDGG